MLKDLIKKLENKEISVLEFLEELQEKNGYISLKKLKKICEELNIPKSKVYGILTFYSYFSTVPRGKYLLRVCAGTACHVKGSRKIIEMLKKEFGLENGKTTEDKRFTLHVIACLGSCFLAPVMMVNSNYFGNLDPEKVKKILRSLK